jgi:hypothetical protein
MYIDGSHRDQFGESLGTLSAVESQSWVYLWAIGFQIHRASLWISLAHKTPSYDKKMLLEIVFDKTSFVKFKVRIKFKQNIEETHLKQPKSIEKSIPAYGF